MPLCSLPGGAQLPGGWSHHEPDVAGLDDDTVLVGQAEAPRQDAASSGARQPRARDLDRDVDRVADADGCMEPPAVNAEQAIELSSKMPSRDASPIATERPSIPCAMRSPKRLSFIDAASVGRVGVPAPPREEDDVRLRDGPALTGEGLADREVLEEHRLSPARRSPRRRGRARPRRVARCAARAGPGRPRREHDRSRATGSGPLRPSTATPTTAAVIGKASSASVAREAVVRSPR